MDELQNQRRGTWDRLARERQLDEAIDCTFPASDPVAMRSEAWAMTRLRDRRPAEMARTPAAAEPGKGPGAPARE